jgi:hypothetical protein
MNPADEMAAKIEPSERQSADGVAGSDDMQRLRATLKNLQRISVQPTPVEDLHGSGDKLSERLEDLLRPSPQRKPEEDLRSLVLGVDRHLDYETSERTIIYDRLRAIDGQMKRLETRPKGGLGELLVVTWSRFVLASLSPWLGSPTARQPSR